MLYVSEDILLKQITLQFTKNKAFEGFSVVINPRKKIVVFCCSYNPNKNKTLSHLHVIGKALDDLSINIIMSSYCVISTMNQKKKVPKYLPFKKYCQTKNLFQKPR